MSSITSPLPTIAPDWSPPASCLAQTAWFEVFWNTSGLVYWDDVLGVPTLHAQGLPITSDPCLPPDYTINVPFVTDGPCPSGFTEPFRQPDGVTYQGVVGDMVTCCPRADGRKFQHTETGPGSWYGCVTTGRPGQTWTGSTTDYNTGGQQVNTLSLDNSNIMWAYGLIMASTPPASGESTSPTGTSSTGSTGGQSDPTSDPSPSDGDGSNGLSTGAAAGIGVGVAVGVIAIAAAAWFIFWKRRRSAAAAAASTDAAFAGTGGATEDGSGPGSGLMAQSELSREEQYKKMYYTQQIPQGPMELHNSDFRPELENTSYRPELEGAGAQQTGPPVRSELP